MGARRDMKLIRERLAIYVGWCESAAKANEPRSNTRAHLEGRADGYKIAINLIDQHLNKPKD